MRTQKATIIYEPRIVLSKTMIEKLISEGYGRVAIFEALNFHRNSHNSEEIRNRALSLGGVTITEPKVLWRV